MNPLTIKLFTLLAKIALVEVPALHDGSPKHQTYLDGMNEMSRIYVDVGKAGLLISPDADSMLLAAIGYEESRHRPQSPDGDCSHLPGGTKCRAFGPMQINKSTPSILGNIDLSWKGSTLEQLRDPETNVKAAYRLMVYWKDQCKGGPAQWLGAWSAGRCSRNPIPMGHRRCALARALGDAAGVEVTGCDTKIHDRHTGRLIAELQKKN